jgi:hypothetical protein
MWIALQQYIIRDDHCQNLNWLPLSLSFIVSPGFKYIIPYLINFRLGGTMDF